ncbi:MAG: hypothetical protein GC162_17420 [Planctomycetes bacterium]|nr:hypothetical protein [Planctomycetota bacterium]
MVDRNAIQSVTLIAAAVVLVCTVGVFAADDPAALPVPRVTSISVAISALNHEVQDSWRKDHAWPRSECNFAAEKNWAVPSDQVITALSRKLNNNPTIDGYIKWQLLSFAPDLAKADAATVNRVVSMMPKPLDAPQPAVQAGTSATGGGNGGMVRQFMFFGQQTSYVRDLDPVVGDGVVAFDPKMGVVNGGSVLDVEGVATIERFVRQVNQQLAVAKATVNAANAPVHAYREALVERLPTEGGVRMAVMLKDVRDRLAAGDPTYEQAMNRLAEASRTLAADQTLDPAVRQTLTQWADTLGQMKTSVITAVTADRKGVFGYERQVLAIPANDAQFVMQQLKAPTGGATK